MVVGRPTRLRPFQRMIWTGLWHRCLMRIIEFSLAGITFPPRFAISPSRINHRSGRALNRVHNAPPCHRVLHSGYRDERMVTGTTVQRRYRNWSIKLGPAASFVRQRRSWRAAVYAFRRRRSVRSSVDVQRFFQIEIYQASCYSAWLNDVERFG